jgi:uncharacterized membrane protein
MPRRSLPPQGFLILMVLVGVLSFAAGVAFLARGAWPVFGFFGLDAAAIYIAFRLNYRAARAYERIEMTRERLLVRKVAANGQRREFSFVPYWTRLEIERQPERGVTRVAVASSGRRLSLGNFLSPGEKEAFADSFASALAAARTMPD